MIPFRFSGLISLLLLVLGQNCIAQKKQDLQMVQQAITSLNEVMIYDITSPPVASRDYAYSLIAFYEAVAPSNKKYKSFSGRLNGLQPLPEISNSLQYDWLLAGMTAFYSTADAFVFSKEKFRQLWDSVNSKYQYRNIKPDVRKRSIEFGELVAAQIIRWAKTDGFAKTRTLPRFTSGKKPGSWQQTGPDFMEAVEPYWNTIHPMILSKPDEFLLPPPFAFKSDSFLAECKEVYTTGNNLTKKQIEITNFWDCNPFATKTVGHLMYSVKKISPAGHWIGITGVAVKLKNQPLAEALYIHSLVSIAIFDAVIAAWDEKYRSNYIRPVTAIQQLISPTWEPALQTPPFPEYPSGHSVISNAAAIILTHFFGDNFRYVDDVEKPYGLSARSYHSFFEAADEAALSRLYGGIHFRESIENGKNLGRYIGEKVLRLITSANDLHQ